MKQIYRVILWVSLSATSIHAWGQKGSVLTQETSEQGTPKYIEFDKRAVLPSQDEEMLVLNQRLGLTDNDQLVLQNKESDKLGFTHEYYKQYYKGIWVESGAYGVHIRNGFIEKINGSFRRIDNLDVKASLTVESALQQAIASFPGKTFKWQVPGEEKFIKQIKNDSSASFYPKGELLIYYNQDGDNQYYLAYKFPIVLQAPDKYYTVYVDAHDGHIIAKVLSNERLTDSSGTADTRHSGSQTISTTNTGGTYVLRETGRGMGIQTLNRTTGGDFSDSDNNWTSSEFHNSAMDDAALDVHWALERSYDYWSNVHSRNSYDNSGALIKALVHYNDAGSVNAQWLGGNALLVFGDGGTNNNMNYDPLTELDIVAHEFGHAVFQGTGNSASNQEGMAVNEGLSDIWGSNVEAWAAPSKNAWVTGEEIITGGAGYERSLSNPSANSYPDVYQGAYWDNGSNGYDPHKNSTVLSHCFYLMSSGGTDRNSSGTAYSLSSLGRHQAELIAYRAESVYLRNHQQPTFSDTRTAFISAANDIGGSSCSNEVITTTNAFYAVGIGNAFPTLDGYYHTGSLNYSMQTVNNVQSGWTEVHVYTTTATWSVANANPNPPNWFTSGNTMYVNLSSGQTATFTVTTSTASCGASTRNVTFTVPSGYYSYTVSPNPASSELNVNFLTNESGTELPELIELIPENAFNVNAVKTVELRSTAAIEQAKTKGQIIMNVADLPRGRYVLQVHEEKAADEAKKIQAIHILLQ